MFWRFWCFVMPMLVPIYLTALPILLTSASPSVSTAAAENPDKNDPKGLPFTKDQLSLPKHGIRGKQRGSKVAPSAFRTVPVAVASIFIVYSILRCLRSLQHDTTSTTKRALSKDVADPCGGFPELSIAEQLERLSLRESEIRNLTKKEREGVENAIKRLKYDLPKTVEAKSEELRRLEESLQDKVMKLEKELSQLLEPESEKPENVVALEKEVNEGKKRQTALTNEIRQAKMSLEAAAYTPSQAGVALLKRVQRHIIGNPLTARAAAALTAASVVNNGPYNGIEIPPPWRQVKEMRRMSKALLRHLQRLHTSLETERMAFRNPVASFEEADMAIEEATHVVEGLKALQVAGYINQLREAAVQLEDIKRQAMIKWSIRETVLLTIELQDIKTLQEQGIVSDIDCLCEIFKEQATVVKKAEAHVPQRTTPSNLVQRFAESLQVGRRSLRCLKEQFIHLFKVQCADHKSNIRTAIQSVKDAAENLARTSGDGEGDPLKSQEARGPSDNPRKRPGTCSLLVQLAEIKQKARRDLDALRRFADVQDWGPEVEFWISELEEVLTESEIIFDRSASAVVTFWSELLNTILVDVKGAEEDLKEERSKKGGDVVSAQKLLRCAKDLAKTAVRNAEIVEGKLKRAGCSPETLKVLETAVKKGKAALRFGDNPPPSTHVAPRAVTRQSTSPAEPTSASSSSSASSIHKENKMEGLPESTGTTPTKKPRRGKTSEYRKGKKKSGATQPTSETSRRTVPDPYVNSGVTRLTFRSPPELVWNLPAILENVEAEEDEELTSQKQARNDV